MTDRLSPSPISLTSGRNLLTPYKGVSLRRGEGVMYMDLPKIGHRLVIARERNRAQENMPRVRCGLAFESVPIKPAQCMTTLSVTPSTPPHSPELAHSSGKLHASCRCLRGSAVTASSLQPSFARPSSPVVPPHLPVAHRLVRQTLLHRGGTAAACRSRSTVGARRLANQGLHHPIGA